MQKALVDFLHLALGRAYFVGVHPATVEALRVASALDTISCERIQALAAAPGVEILYIGEYIYQSIG